MAGTRVPHKCMWTGSGAFVGQGMRTRYLNRYEMEGEITQWFCNRERTHVPDSQHLFISGCTPYSRRIRHFRPCPAPPLILSSPSALLNLEQSSHLSISPPLPTSQLNMSPRSDLPTEAYTDMLSSLSSRYLPICNSCRHRDKVFSVALLGIKKRQAAQKRKRRRVILRLKRQLVHVRSAAFRGCPPAHASAATNSSEDAVSVHVQSGSTSPVPSLNYDTSPVLSPTFSSTTNSNHNFFRNRGHLHRGSREVLSCKGCAFRQDLYRRAETKQSHAHHYHVLESYRKISGLRRDLESLNSTII